MRFLCICVCDYNNEAEDKTTTGWTNSKAIPSWEVTAGGTKQCPPPPLTRSSLCPYTHYTNSLNPIKIVEKNYGQTHMCLQACVHVGCQDLGKVSHALRKPPSKAPKITTSRVNATKIHGKRVSFVCWLAGWPQPITIPDLLWQTVCGDTRGRVARHPRMTHVQEIQQEQQNVNSMAFRCC